MPIDKFSFPPELKLMIVQYIKDRREVAIICQAEEALSGVQTVVTALSMVWGSDLALQVSNLSEEMMQRNEILFNAMLRQGFAANEIPVFLDSIFNAAEPPQPTP